MAGANPALLNKNHGAVELVADVHVAATLHKDKGYDAVMESFVVKNFTKKGDNIVTFVTSVVVSYLQAGEKRRETYIVKLDPCNQIEDFEPFYSFMFSKECGFYTNVVPELDKIFKKIEQPPLRVPRFFHSANPLGRDMIFLEDLRPNYKMCDRMKGMDLPHAILVVEELARLHASSVIVIDALGCEILKKFPTLLDIYSHNCLGAHPRRLIDETFAGFAETGADIAMKFSKYDKVVVFLNMLAPHYLSIMEEQMKSRQSFRAVCHGDCWNNNLLFRYNNEGKPVEIRLIDHQMNRVGSLATDLNQFLFTSLTGDTRKEGLSSILSAYFSSYEKVFSAAKRTMPFTLVELKQEYHDKHLFGLLTSLVILPIAFTPPEKAINFPEFTDDNMVVKMIEQKNVVLDMFEKNSDFRLRFSQMFDEILEHKVVDETVIERALERKNPPKVSLSHWK